MARSGESKPEELKFNDCYNQIFQKYQMPDAILQLLSIFVLGRYFLHQKEFLSLIQKWCKCALVVSFSSLETISTFENPG